jgi:hypothetical protein
MHDFSVGLGEGSVSTFERVCPAEARASSGSPVSTPDTVIDLTELAD